jgi:hypothetical protein
MKDRGLSSPSIGGVSVCGFDRRPSTERMNAGSCSFASICDCVLIAFKVRMKAGSRSFNLFKVSGDFGVEHLSGDGVRVPSETSKVRVHMISPCCRRGVDASGGLSNSFWLVKLENIDSRVLEYC